MADVGGRIETSSSVYNAKSAFMDIQVSQSHAQHPSGSGSPDGVAAGTGFGSPASGTPSSSYHHHVRLSPPPVASYHHHMHGPSPHHHHHQQSQIDIPAAGFMSSNPSVQVTNKWLLHFFSQWNLLCLHFPSICMGIWLLNYYIAVFFQMLLFISTICFDILLLRDAMRLCHSYVVCLTVCLSVCLYASVTFTSGTVIT